MREQADRPPSPGRGDDTVQQDRYQSIKNTEVCPAGAGVTAQIDARPAGSGRRQCRRHSAAYKTHVLAHLAQCKGVAERAAFLEAERLCPSLPRKWRAKKTEHLQAMCRDLRLGLGMVLAHIEAGIYRPHQPVGLHLPLKVEQLEIIRKLESLLEIDKVQIAAEAIQRGLQAMVIEACGAANRTGPDLRWLVHRVERWLEETPREHMETSRVRQLQRGGDV